MTKRKEQDFSKHFFAAPSNDDTRPFSPAGAARPFSPTFVELIAHFRAANENAILDKAVAVALREFYLANSALVAWYEIGQQVLDENDRKAVVAQVLDSLYRLFWAAQIRRSDDDIGGTPLPPPPTDSFALRDPLIVPKIDVVANAAAGKSTNVTRLPIFRSDRAGVEMPQIIRSMRDVEFGDDRGASTIGTNAKKRKPDWLTLAIDNTISEAGNALNIKRKDVDAAPAGDGSRPWTAAELGNRLHPAYWATRSVSPTDRDGQVFISFNLPFEQKTRIVKLLMDLLEPRLIHAGYRRPFVFTDRTDGTTYGEEFVPEVVERIRTAIAGIIIQSAPYFASDYCRLELALLLQRHREGKMPIYPIFGGHHSFGAAPVFVPSRPGFADAVRMSALGDDRKGHPDWKPDMAYQPLQSLIDTDQESALMERLLAVVEDLMRRLTGDRAE
jgi:hypothetical protein